MYTNDDDFSAIYHACEKTSFEKFYKLDGYLFKENQLCISKSSTRELLIKEVHGWINGEFWN